MYTLHEGTHREGKHMHHTTSPRTHQRNLSSMGFTSLKLAIAVAGLFASGCGAATADELEDSDSSQSALEGMAERNAERNAAAPRPEPHPDCHERCENAGYEPNECRRLCADDAAVERPNCYERCAGAGLEPSECRRRCADEAPARDAGAARPSCHDRCEEARLAPPRVPKTLRRRALRQARRLARRPGRSSHYRESDGKPTMLRA